MLLFHSLTQNNVHDARLERERADAFPPSMDLTVIFFSFFFGVFFNHSTRLPLPLLLALRGGHFWPKSSDRDDNG